MNEHYANGALQSFGLNFGSDGPSLKSGAIATTPTYGPSPAHVAWLSDGSVATANYMGGNSRIIPPLPQGQEGRFTGAGQTVDFNSLSTTGQSHPHQVVERNGELWIPDLGADTVWRLGRSSTSNGQWSVQGQVKQPKGSGPRHIIFQGTPLYLKSQIQVVNTFLGDRAFTLHELSSTLALHSIPSNPKDTAQVYTIVSTTPPNPPPNAQYAAAEILIPPVSARFPTSYIFVSNRNKGNVTLSEGDSIAIYQHVNKGQANEGLQLINQVFTGLNQVRGMEFGKGTDGEAYLIAGGAEGSTGIAVFERTDGGKGLKLVVRNKDIPTRTGFLWLN